MYLIELKQFNIWKINSKTCSANALVFSSSKFEFVTEVNPSKVRIGTKRSSIYTSPQNENLNLLVRIKFLNLFLYSSLKINWSWVGGPVLSWGLLHFMLLTNFLVLLIYFTNWIVGILLIGTCLNTIHVSVQNWLIDWWLTPTLVGSIQLYVNCYGMYFFFKWVSLKLEIKYMFTTKSKSFVIK